MKLSRDLTCAEVVELVTEYLEGGLSPDERERFEEHLGVCEDDLAPEIEDALIRVFRGWKTE